VKVPVEVGDALASYVYVYIDPRNHHPFYVGKGKGNRLFSHLDDQTESEKVRRINELLAVGLEPQIDVLRYGLSDAEAALVEAAAIDLIGRPPLTNVVAGHRAQSFGRITSQEVIAMLTAKPVVVRQPAILITINQLYPSGMTPPGAADECRPKPAAVRDCALAATSAEFTRLRPRAPRSAARTSGREPERPSPGPRPGCGRRASGRSDRRPRRLRRRG